MRVVALLLLLMLGCRADAVDAMARTTKLVDEQYSNVYVEVADICREQSHNWDSYDDCMQPWKVGADAVTSLRNVTLSLDADHGRKAFKSATCRWFEALSVVDALSPSPLPAAKAALRSRYRRRC